MKSKQEVKDEIMQVLTNAGYYVGSTDTANLLRELANYYED